MRETTSFANLQIRSGVQSVNTKNTWYCPLLIDVIVYALLRSEDLRLPLEHTLFYSLSAEHHYKPEGGAANLVAYTTAFRITTLFGCRILLSCLASDYTCNQVKPCSTLLLLNHKSQRLYRVYKHEQHTPAGRNSSFSY